MAKKKKSNQQVPVSEMDLADLVDIVRSRGRMKKERADEAYEEICYRMKNIIYAIASKMYIPGHTTEDVLQEALFALRYKAIPDYDRDVEGQNGPYPFDKFAALCIRRYLSTLLKTCYQNKQKTLNTSCSLHQEQGEDGDDLFLIDVICNSNDSLLDVYSQKEYRTYLLNKVYEKLSKFEKMVFILYIHKYTYAEMAILIKKKRMRDNCKNKDKDIDEIIKSVDNALSRMKSKAKEVMDKYHLDDLEN